MIAGYSTDIDLTVDPALRCPEDPAGRLDIGTLLYPFNLHHIGGRCRLGKVVSTWGTDEKDYQRIKGFEKMKVRFHDQGYPVIVGEYERRLRLIRIRTV